tara:strand:+ start:728 stop:913 length:186 start_codon:yes stop_codon:yes gene_type:complete
MQLADIAWNIRKIKNWAVFVTKTVARVDKQNIIKDQRIRGLLPNWSENGPIINWSKALLAK